MAVFLTFLKQLQLHSLARPQFHPISHSFKFRNKIGLDVALEALRECLRDRRCTTLRECLRDRRCTTDELWHYAKICRVANVMQPYMEAISSWLGT
jgi:hypothetical protein